MRNLATASLLAFTFCTLSFPKERVGEERDAVRYRRHQNRARETWTAGGGLAEQNKRVGNRATRDTGRRVAGDEDLLAVNKRGAEAGVK